MLDLVNANKYGLRFPKSVTDCLNRPPGLVVLMYQWDLLLIPGRDYTIKYAESTVITVTNSTALFRQGNHPCEYDDRYGMPAVRVIGITVRVYGDPTRVKNACRVRLVPIIPPSADNLS